MRKVRGWKLDSYYKKWELYLFRLFKLANYVESILRIHRLNAPTPEQFLKPEGYEDNNIRIPANPFLMEKDEEMFLSIYDDLIDLNYKDRDKDYQQLLKEIWKRIAEIKEWLGITRGTRCVGKEKEEWRLVNEIDWYIKYYELAPMIYRVILGDPKKERPILIKFKNFLRDRSKINSPKSLKYY